jgi:NAD(P)-dependent dehydrogenase (short-subunit alcohol dehydrogenase family)
LFQAIRLTLAGATNGIGLDSTIFLAKASADYHVIMGARNLQKAEERIKEIQAKDPKGTLSVVHLDITNDESIFAAVKSIEEDFGRLDILINNAGISIDGHSKFPTRETFRNTFETNLFGPTILTEAAVHLLKKSKDPKVINVTSGLGSIGGIVPHLSPETQALVNVRDITVPAYRMSKAALNMLSVYQFHQFRDFGCKVWAYCPGYVVTDLAGMREMHEKSPYTESSETSAQGILEIVRGDRDGEAGGYITKRGEQYPW